MNSYLSVKFQGEDSEETVRELITAIERTGFTVTAPVRDFDDFGRNNQDVTNLVPYMTNALDHTDIVFVDATDKGVGIGFEAGYAAANGIPVIVLHYGDSEISPILELAARRILPYNSYEELYQQLETLKRTLEEEEV